MTSESETSNQGTPAARGNPANAKSNYVVDLSERLRLMRDGLINNSNLLVSAPVGIILVPIMLKGLGTEAYGLWMAALALCAVAGTLDFGILPSTLRAVAGDASGDIRDATRKFVGAAWKAYFLIGLLGAAVNSAVGLLLSHGLHLSAENVAIAPAVFCVAGLSYCALQLLNFTIVIFYALRRFDLTNIIGIATTLTSAAGVILLLHAGGRLLIVAGWIAAINWASLLVAILVIRRLKPQLHFGEGRLKWTWLRPHVSFGLWSQLANLADVVHMQSGSLLIGTVIGSGAITPYAVGQKFPIAVARIQERATDVIFPAASQAERSEGLEATHQILETGTRWMIVLMVPLYLGLAVVAPQLLRAWIGQTGPDEIAVLRLTCVAMAAIAIGGASEQVLWGRGEARRVFSVIFVSAAIHLVLCFFLLGRVGLQGAAWALGITMMVRALTYIVLGARRGRMAAADWLRKSLHGAVVPMAACGAAAYVVLHFARPGRWPDLVAACLAGGLAYGLSLYFGGARPEEKMLAKEILTFPFTFPRFIWRSLREKLRHVAPHHPSLIFLALLKRLLTYRPERISTHLERIFAESEDPFNCLTDPAEQQRYRYELEMLDAVRGQARFPRALEVGCAEGVFTKMLAANCRSLLAVDISPTALTRARERLKDLKRVRVERWDMRSDALEEKFDLIVLTVLSNLVLPREFRRARETLVGALEPGGYLLMGDLRWDEVYEKAWWTKRLFVGGKWLLEFMGQHPELKVVSRYDLDPWVHTLFRKI